MDSLPKVSICIPVYNAEEFIAKAIESALNQTYKDFEIIIVNDASTDNTLSEIKKYNDSRIKIYNNETNIGMVANWNKSLELSNGEYVKFLFQDDIILPTLLEKQVEALDDHPDVTLVSTSSYIINESGDVKAKRNRFPKSGKYNGKEVARKSIRRGNIFGEPSLVMIRKSVFKQTGYFDDRYFYVPDWDMWLKCLYYGNYYHINEYLTKFRVSKGSATTNIMLKKSYKMIQNDRLFLNSHKRMNEIKISKVDEFIHYLNLLTTTIMKIVFIKFVV